MIPLLSTTLLALTSPTSTTPDPATAPPAQEPARIVDSPEADLQVLVARISQKLRTGQATHELLAPEIGEFDALLAKYASRKNDAVARIALMRAMLFVEVLGDYDRAWPLLEQFQREYAHTFLAKSSFNTIQQVRREMDSAGLLVLTPGSEFPGFASTDINGQRFALEDYRGRVLLVHFWATWNPESHAQLPLLRAAWEAYQKRGFSIIGISLDEDEAALRKALEDEHIEWPQHNDGHRWENEIVQLTGVTYIPGLYLIDRDGHIIARRFPAERLEHILADHLGP